MKKNREIVLLSREDFNSVVQQRDNHSCIMCGCQEGLTVHHIMDRSLFESGGYLEDNGVTLCERCHKEAENGHFSCRILRERAKIDNIILPPHLEGKALVDLDKWGSEVPPVENLTFLRSDTRKSKDDIGDFLWWTEYVTRIDGSELLNREDIPLVLSPYYGIWGNMEHFGFNKDFITVMRKKALYECPFDKNLKFYGIIPVAIISDNIYKYRRGKMEHRVFDWWWDYEFRKGMHCSAQVLDPKEGGKLYMAYLGHGYTYGTFPSDGSNEMVAVKVKISNGDILLCYTWEWFNK